MKRRGLRRDIPRDRRRLRRSRSRPPLTFGGPRPRAGIPVRCHPTRNSTRADRPRRRESQRRRVEARGDERSFGRRAWKIDPRSSDDEEGMPSLFSSLSGFRLEAAPVSILNHGVPFARTLLNSRFLERSAFQVAPEAGFMELFGPSESRNSRLPTATRLA